MNEREIFIEALNRPDPAARAAYLDEACGDDVSLRARLDELLIQHHENASVLDRNPGELLGLAGHNSPESSDGDVEATVSQEAQLALFLEPSTRPDGLGRIGHYEVLQVVGHGGFGIVVKAFDERLHRMVAIKFLTPHLARTSPPRKRFLREARSAAVVRHEHVVQIYAVEEQPLPYLVMEYIDGPSLQQHLDQVGPLESTEIVRLGQQIAQGLAAAHARGLVHHDVKPGNILLESGGESRVKLTDFGVARTMDAASLTHSGLIGGTPMFMAPEQILGERLDHRADLFSLGSVLYTMCVGHPPFRAANTFAILRRVVEDTPRPVIETIPEVPTGLQAVISCLHRKDPDERFASADAVVDALSRCLQGSVALPAESPARSGWKRPVLALVALGLIVALGWAIGQFTRPNKSADPRPQVAADPEQSFPEADVSETAVQIPPANEETTAEAAPALTEEERWENAVAMMPAEDQYEAVVARLKKLNPQSENPNPWCEIKDDVLVLFAINDTRNVHDLSPLRAFRGLRELQLYGEDVVHNVADLGQLRGMKLTRFDSIHNPIEDLSPLSEMPLEWLGVWGFGGTDLSPLRGMKIRGLNCGGSAVKDLSPLKDLPLKYLCVNYSQVQDLSPLAELPLQVLEVEHTRVSDLTPIAGLPLEVLCLGGTPIADYSPLAQMPLKELRLDYDPDIHERLLRSISTLETVNHQPIAEFFGSDGN